MERMESNLQSQQKAFLTFDIQIFYLHRHDRKNLFISYYTNLIMEVISPFLHRYFDHV